MEGLLSREDLLAKDELQIEKVELGNGKFVYVRQMTGSERDQFEQSLMKETKGKGGAVTYERDLSHFRAKLAVNTVCDDKGVNILQMKDAVMLSQNKAAATLEKIVNKAQELNKISDEDRDNLVKNSEAAQNEDSTSDSVES